MEHVWRWCLIFFCSPGNFSLFEFHGTWRVCSKRVKKTRMSKMKEKYYKKNEIYLHFCAWSARKYYIGVNAVMTLSAIIHLFQLAYVLPQTAHTVFPIGFQRNIRRQIVSQNNFYHASQPFIMCSIHFNEISLTAKKISNHSWCYSSCMVQYHRRYKATFQHRS